MSSVWPFSTVSDEGSRNKMLLHSLHFADECLTFMKTLAF